MTAPTETIPTSDPHSLIASKLAECGLDANSPEFAIWMDKQFVTFRDQFRIPKVKTVVPAGTVIAEEEKDKEATYLCGNSLGLQPKKLQELLQEELQVWADRGVNGHFDHPFGRPWVSIDDLVIEQSAKIVGAKPAEVAIMNSLSCNLHLMMVPFYRPTPTRFKIVIEKKPFPSDFHIVSSQLQFHGYEPAKALIQIEPRAGETFVRTEDFLKAIEEQGDSIALVLIGGVQYYTGQFFDIPAITKAGHAKGCIVGCDLAHAVGNVLLKLHDWDVDFACWCSYKYLNSGPGSIGGAFVHERHHQNTSLPRFAGWWGSDPETKFEMESVFNGIPGANGYRLSNPCVLAVMSVYASLEIFSQTSMESLVHKSRVLTGYLESRLVSSSAYKKGLVSIITPRDPTQRGCQLSLLFKTEEMMLTAFTQMARKGLVVDERKPNVIRVAPAPLYNTFQDVYQFVSLLEDSLTRFVQ